MDSKEKIRAEALDFLKKNTTAVIATAANNKPYASTVYYAVDDSFNFYFSTKINTAKYFNISFNCDVAIVVGTGPKTITIQAHGKADFIFGDERKKAEQELINKKVEEFIINWPAEIMQKFKDKTYVYFKVFPEQVLFMNIDDNNYPESISNKYHQIIP